MSEFFKSYTEAFAVFCGLFTVSMWGVGANEFPLWLIMLNVAFVAYIIGQWSERFLLRIEKRRQL